MEEQVTTPAPEIKPSCDKLFKASLVIIGFLIVVGLFGNIYLLLRKDNKKTISSEQNLYGKPTQSSSSFVPTINQTATWKEYENKYKYSLEIPEGWGAMLGTNPSIGWVSESIGPIEELNDPRGNSVGIHVFKEEEMSDAERVAYSSYYTQEQFNEWFKKEASNGEGKEFYKVENIKISGNNAIKFIEKSLPGDVVGPYYRIIIWVRNNRMNYYITLGWQEEAVNKYLKEYDQILSTFKFLD